MPGALTTVLIIPTGIGAAMGGYAGDAIPVVRALGQVCDQIITHPNVLNGAQLYWSMPNVAYVEGYGLDQFAAGAWGLKRVSANRIGLLFDQAIEPDLRLRHLQAAEACRATLGLKLTDYVITDQPLGVELRTSPSGATWGTLKHPDSLLRAAAKLIETAQAQAIAIVARFPDQIDAQALSAYRQGQGVDPLAGAEAIISHLVVREFQIPAAHAPALMPLPLDATLSPQAAAEELGYTFLPSVLVGLSQAPQFVSLDPQVFHDRPDVIDRQCVDVVISPAGACGGPGLLALSQTQAQIITVVDNPTTLNVTAEGLGIKALAVQSYAEAIGVLAAMKAGVAVSRLWPRMGRLQELSKE
ncbi:DUF3326 domain-containing protein [Thermosynechococcaceae cyanobacterium BACA0444]|uniref:DUF3326 domain-containing protein n=1 Tax=Pseudocalidococcus azoricus BACA0444 TaxID=2918990 RepID=A0AAE4JWI9_9CYAN|nr:DUF3326 domain-containing protein [Pseudocalidococcus azoricus]MDS3860203.1 DUF3326 domain-containing protein [Pseudocalidococcus azoricus BACA0444]